MAKGPSNGLAKPERRQCEPRSGETPAQVCHEWTPWHLVELECRPGRRALTYDEVQALSDAHDARVEQIRSEVAKGALAALRDAVILSGSLAGCGSRAVRGVVRPRIPADPWR